MAPTIHFVINPPLVTPPAIGDVQPADIAPPPLDITWPVQAVHFTSDDLQRAKDAIAGDAQDGPAIVRKVLRAVFRDATFEKTSA